ncbi:WYL domain-containing protein [bacterium]|nr:WYL domain-containing protein [bacterium]
MKHFKKNNTVTYNLISYTGFKSLLLFSLLLDAPHTFEEIQDFYRTNEYIHEEISFDTIRVYMTSLKRIGCEIARKRYPEGSRYHIVSHPFEFKVDADQIKAVTKIYKILLQSASVADLFACDTFLRDLAAKIGSKELLNIIEKMSVFNGVSSSLVKELIECSKDNRKITILYNSPQSGEKDIQLIANGLSYKDDKIYLNGISLEYSQETAYLLDRIKDISAIHEQKSAEDVEIKYTTVGYELSNLTTGAALDENEKIVEIKEDSILIEAYTSNLFMLKRKILSYGPLCTVLYPEDFRNDIISTLKKMQEEYQND